MASAGILWTRKIGPFKISGRNLKIKSIKIGHFGWHSRGVR